MLYPGSDRCSDAEAGGVIDFTEVVDTRGPHPILEGGGLDPVLACDYLA